MIGPDDEDQRDGIEPVGGGHLGDGHDGGEFDRQERGQEPGEDLRRGAEEIEFHVISGGSHDSCPRVCFLIDLFHPFGADMRVDLRGAQIFMPQKRLHAPEIGARIQQMGGKRMPQLVGRQIG